MIGNAILGYETSENSFNNFFTILSLVLFSVLKKGFNA